MKNMKKRKRPRGTPHSLSRDPRGQGLLWSSRCPCRRCVFHRAALWLAQRLSKETALVVNGAEP